MAFFFASVHLSDYTWFLRLERAIGPDSERAARLGEIHRVLRGTRAETARDDADRADGHLAKLRELPVAVEGNLILANEAAVNCVALARRWAVAGKRRLKLANATEFRRRFVDFETHLRGWVEATQPQLSAESRLAKTIAATPPSAKSARPRFWPR